MNTLMYFGHHWLMEWNKIKMNKQNEWLDDIITALNQLGGEANYEDLYPAIEKLRVKRNKNLYTSFKAVVRRTIQEHSKETKSFKYFDVFYSVNGLGKGRWGLLPNYRTEQKNTHSHHKNKTYTAYQEGLEGIAKEATYIKKSRNPRLVEERKKIDNYTCQACGYFQSTGTNRYVIDVHHKKPIGNLEEAAVTSIDDVVCLCPNCHRIAHSRKETPLSIEEIKGVLNE